MPVTLTAYDDNETILIYSFEGDWSWAEFSHVDEDVWKRFNQTDNRIDLIFDLTRSNRLPLGINEILHRAGRRTAPPEKGLGVVINAPSFTQIIIGALKRIYPKAAKIYRFVNTLEEAIQVIDQHRLS